jgi:hypothetical protein
MYAVWIWRSRVFRTGNYTWPVQELALQIVYLCMPQMDKQGICLHKCVGLIIKNLEKINDFYCIFVLVLRSAQESAISYYKTNFNCTTYVLLFSFQNLRRL